MAMSMATASTVGVRFHGGGKRGGILAESISQMEPDVVVAKPGSGGNCTTIGEALKRYKAKEGRKYFLIYINEGTYEEHVVITDKHVVLIGDGMGKTIITGSLCNRTGQNTEESATLTVSNPRFMARDLTIENTAGAPDDHQAVALFSNSNGSVFYKCEIKGYQDTLFANQNLQFYRDCRIWGTVDFIFGDNTAVFQNCDIYVRRPSDVRKHDVITAQGRLQHEGSSGFVFQNCTITTSPLSGEVLAGVQTYLGRPWKNHARVVFMMCSVDGIIHADGWVSWKKSEQPGQGGPANDEFHIYYAEYKNHGLGASVTQRVKWDGFHVIQTDDEAKQFTPRKFIHGGDWLPQTGVPFYHGLN